MRKMHLIAIVLGLLAMGACSTEQMVGTGARRSRWLRSWGQDRSRGRGGRWRCLWGRSSTEDFVAYPQRGKNKQGERLPKTLKNKTHKGGGGKTEGAKR